MVIVANCKLYLQANRNNVINAKGEFGPRDVTDFALNDLYAIGDLFYPLWNLLQLSATGNLAC